MRVLLDTHTLLWWLTDDEALGDRARDVVADPETVAFVSAASLWEIAAKISVGRLQIADDIDLPAVVAEAGFLDLPVIHYSVTWWRTLHPEPKVMTEGSLGGGVEPVMLACLGAGVLAAFALFATLFTLRLRLEKALRGED